MLKIICQNFARRSKRNQVPRIYRLAEFNTRNLQKQQKEPTAEQKSMDEMKQLYFKKIKEATEARQQPMTKQTLTDKLQLETLFQMGYSRMNKLVNQISEEDKKYLYRNYMHLLQRYGYTYDLNYIIKIVKDIQNLGGLQREKDFELMIDIFRKYSSELQYYNGNLQNNASIKDVKTLDNFLKEESGKFDKESRGYSKFEKIQEKLKNIKKYAS